MAITVMDRAAAPTYFGKPAFSGRDGVVRRISVTQSMFHNVYARAETRSIARKIGRAAALVSLDIVMAKDFWLTCPAPRR